MLRRSSTATALVCWAVARLSTHRTVVPSCYATALAMSTSASSTTPAATVNLLDMAAAAIACTVTASRSIRAIAGDTSASATADNNDTKNTRLKPDGSFVTDADFAAQGVIVQAVKTVCPTVRIVGEESEEEMASHIGQHAVLDDDIMEQARKEVRIRRHGLACTSLPLASRQTTETAPAADPLELPDDTPDVVVDASRVSIIVDPLDGTKSYAHGDYDSVSILIAIVLDGRPCFGVIGKPFGYTGLPNMLDAYCATVYGGPLLNGVFIAGAEPLTVSSCTDAAAEDLPRAVISGSRSRGVVLDFCLHLGEKGLIHPEPILVSGAGEKSLRLILRKEKEALWFFPKGGTSLWDVAAPDALLQSLGGKLTNKFGKELDYSKSREEAENVEGVIACIDVGLHDECIRLFHEGDWSTRE